jgi:putative cell wall-binding protein
MRAVRRAVATLIAVLALAFSAHPAAGDDAAPLPVEHYIVGGTTSAPGAWPGMVALVATTPSGLEQVCGGTLIRADLVVTAAHCTDAFPSASQIQVLLGRTDLTVSGGELVQASSVITHPEWSPVLWRNDLSIIRLSEPSGRTPVPFLTRASEPNWAVAPGGTVVGWGATNASGTTSSPQLKELSVSVLSDDECVGRVRTYFVGGDLCVEAPTQGPCPGDSGGPFMAPVGGSQRLAGIISRGPVPCGNGPSIVTRVAAYADWIYQSTMSASTTRTAGPDRYTTAAALSARFESLVPVAYLVTGEAFPDAVTAAAVAGRLGGPVLLTERDQLPPATRAELARLQPMRLVVVGGRGAISDQVVSAAADWAGVAPTRLAGADRYSTAAALAADAYPAGADTVFLTVGTSFPDAVASGPVAGGPNGGPVLLTEAGSLPAPTRDRLVALSPSRVVILGGNSAVNPAIETELASLLPGVVLQRIAGSDRFATSAALSSSAFAPGVPVVYVATGLAFPDALASGPLAVRSGAPVLLVDGPRLPQSVADEIRRLQPGRIEVLGGGNAVPLDTMWRLDGLR